MVVRKGCFVIMSLKAQTKIKLKHMEEKEKKDKKILTFAQKLNNKVN